MAMVHCADQQYGQSRPQNLDDLLLYSHYIVDQVRISGCWKILGCGGTGGAQHRCNACNTALV